jgi:hypothetical protein
MTNEGMQRERCSIFNASLQPELVWLSQTVLGNWLDTQFSIKNAALNAL